MIAQVLKMFVWMMLLTGLVYPMIITAIAQLTMNHKANGSMIISNKKILGSKLIAQKFESDKYFWPRPSAVDYNPLPSGGSNLGPISLELKNLVKQRGERISKAHHVEFKEIPSELLYASGSGLDPHISVKAAFFQSERVAKARQFNESEAADLRKLINSRVKPHFLDFFGHPCINILELNQALDEMKKTS